MKVFEIRKADESVTVWKLGDGDQESRRGEFFIETYGDPALTADEFAKMAAAVAAASK